MSGPTYALVVDGEQREVRGADQSASLSHVLRERLGVAAVKNGCDQGRCGSCAVLLDGLLVTSCTVLAADVEGSVVVTAAGLAPDGPGSVAQALVDAGAVQCGYCTPGMVVAIHDLLTRNPSPTDAQARLALSGNLCRCTGYGRILAAVRALAT